jgi:hypothetical protein
MYKGRLIRCESPDLMRSHADEVCYAIETPNLRAMRDKLRSCEGVLSVESSGDSLHVLISPAKTSPALLQQTVGPAAFRPITPSLEDVFIATIRKAERQDAA